MGDHPGAVLAPAFDHVGIAGAGEPLPEPFMQGAGFRGPARGLQTEDAARQPEGEGPEGGGVHLLEPVDGPAESRGGLFQPRALQVGLGRGGHDGGVLTESPDAPGRPGRGSPG